MFSRSRKAKAFVTGPNLRNSPDSEFRSGLTNGRIFNVNEKIQQAPLKLFERHRIVFWYYAKRELRNDLESLHLPGIEKIELANNESRV